MFLEELLPYSTFIHTLSKYPVFKIFPADASTVAILPDFPQFPLYTKGLPFHFLGPNRLLV